MDELTCENENEPLVPAARLASELLIMAPQWSPSAGASGDFVSH